MSAFPLYRKYPNGSSFFKIEDSENFEELQFIGSQCVIHRYKATILPDRYLLSDMIEMRDNQWVAIEAKTYENVRRDYSRES